MGICQTSSVFNPETVARCEYLTRVRGLTLSDLDRGAPYSDVSGNKPVFKTVGVGENDCTLSPQEIDRAAIALAEHDFVKTTSTVQDLRKLGLSIEWLPNGGPLLTRTLQEIKYLQSTYLAAGLTKDDPSYRTAMACGLMKFHQRQGISFRNAPMTPVSATQISPGQKLECVSYAGLYYSAALLAGLNPHWQQAIWPEDLTTHLYVGIPMEDSPDAPMITVDLMTGTCSPDSPFTDATTRELSSLEALAQYPNASGAITNFQQALTYAPNDYQANYNSGLWYVHHGDAEMGRYYLDRALELFPTMPRAMDVRQIITMLSSSND